jgi:endonuclease YncB( thermonuclease family)
MLEILLCVVVGVTDGDSLTARCDAPDGQVTIQVRLAEIDAPEKRQAFGTRSKEHLAALCFGKSAVVHPKTRDRYGRTVARVACEGVDASTEQVRAGMAWAFTKYFTDPKIERDEADARSRAVGLWIDAEPVEPWKWRREKVSAHP